MLAIFTTLALREACADSDSYFCTSAGYLAYELREWSAPEKRHVLKLVFVGGAEGIAEPTTVSLEDFQLHGYQVRLHRSKRAKLAVRRRTIWSRALPVCAGRARSPLPRRKPSGAISCASRRKVLRRRLVHRGTAEETVD